MCKIILSALLILSVSCSHSPTSSSSQSSATQKPISQKEFGPGEVIVASQLLTKIFDGEMAPLSCVPDKDEASLLIRTLRPRMEIVQDDLEAGLDDPKDVNNLIQNCQQNCSCHFIDEMFREHQVELTKEQKKIFEPKRSKKELNRCMVYIQNTFCQGDLYQSLENEKSDFSFEE